MSSIAIAVGYCQHSMEVKRVFNFYPTKTYLNENY